MNRRIYRHCLLLASLAFSLLCATTHARAQDSVEQTVSAGFGSVPLQQAIEMLAKSGNGIVIKYDASLCDPKTKAVDPRKVDTQVRVSLSIENYTIGKALQTVLDKANIPLTYRRMGDVYTIIPDPSRKAQVPSNRPDAVPESGSQNFTFTKTPFDVAIDTLFRAYHLLYVIDPDVPVIREEVTCVIANARVGEALTALLSSLHNPKTALTYRFEGRKFVITTKEGGGAPPPVAKLNGGFELDSSGMALDEALHFGLDATHANYFYAGSLNGKQLIVIKRRFDSEEDAVVAILRSAQPEPMWIYRKEGNLVTLLTTDQGPSGSTPPATSITCHCINGDFMPVVKAIFQAFHKNYRIDESFRHATITLSLDHVSFEDAYKAICSALPKDVAHMQNGIYDFGN